MAAIANVTLENTFEDWRKITNQVVTAVNEIESNNALIKAQSNTPSLIVTSNISRGGTIYIAPAFSTDLSNTFTTVIASANVVNALNEIVIADIAAVNAWANSIGVTSTDWANGVGAASNAYAVSVGAAGNVLAVFQGASSNGYANIQGAISNTWANTQGGISNTWANTQGGISNTWANTRVYSVTSNSTSRVWANTTVSDGMQNVYVDLANSGVTAGEYGGATQMPVLTIDSYGRVASATNISFISGSTIGVETVSATTFYPVFTTTTSGTMQTANISSSGLTYVPSTGTLSATVFNSLSDASLKENISPITNALDVIENLTGLEFDWKKSGQHSYGVLAQDMEKVLPDLVGNINNTKTVNYDGIIAFLIEAIKELNAKLESK